MVEGAARALSFEQNQFQRRVLDFEVCVTLLALGYCSVEHLLVEVDRCIEVFDVEGELYTHVVSHFCAVVSVSWENILMIVNMFYNSLYKHIEVCQYVL